MTSRPFLLAAAFLSTGCGLFATDPEEDPCQSAPLDLDLELGAGDSQFHVEGLSVAEDGACNLLVAGMAQGEIDLGGGPVGAKDAPFVFVVKLDPEGRHLWSKAFPPGAALAGKRVLAVDSGDGVHLAGTVYTDVDLGGGPLGGEPEDGSGEIFLLALDAEGNHVRSRRLAGNVPADVDYSGSFGRVVESVAIDREDGLVIGGHVRGETDFGGVTLASTPFESAPEYPLDYRPDVFVARYDAGGDLVFAQLFGGPDYERSVGLDVTPAGDIVVAFNDSGDGAGGPSGLRSMKLAPDGSTVWTELAEGSGTVFPPSVTATEDGGLVLGGHGTLALGPIGTFGPSFVGRYGADGQPPLGAPFEGGEVPVVSAVAPDENDGILALGWFQGTLLVSGKALAESGGGIDAFEAHVELQHDALSGSASGEAGDDLNVALTRTRAGGRLIAGLRGPLFSESSSGTYPSGGARLFLRRSPAP